jgi:uncharacterized protein (TIGR00369 family)
MAIRLDISSNRRSMNGNSPGERNHGPQGRLFQVEVRIGWGLAVFPSSQWQLECAEQDRARKQSLMQQQPQASEFGIAEANRVLGEVFAPWVMELNLSIEEFDFAPPADAADWQPGAILRMPFSERLCRNGGMVSGQALMAFADTAMVIANLAANRGYRPMTTVDQTTHFMRAVTASDVLADARVVRLGRTMSFGRVTLLGASDNKPVAMVSSAFAMLPG